jgi:(1->4)-alpha-D-glucan 1-alpha-D-glucosylmutase
VSAPDELVERLAALVGVAGGYTDQLGRPVPTPLGARRAVLEGLGFDLSSTESGHESLARAEAVKAAPLPALIPVEAGRSARVPLRAPSGSSATWRLTEESGGTREGRVTPTGDALVLPALGPGYHNLELAAGGAPWRATVIAAPRRCWSPRSLRDGARLWGLTTQVYALRGTEDLGIGGYAEVATLAERAGALGADFLGLSPVHALFASDRTKISPYSPSSRLFLESLFIDPTRIEGFGGSPAETLLAERGAELSALQGQPLIDHAAAWALKAPLLEALFEAGALQGDDFAAFRRDGGAALEAHAVFEALSAHFRAEGRWWLGDWPEAYRRADAPEVARFAAENPRQVAYHAWLQHVADVQLGQAAAEARRSGMSIGLYRDLAVGGDLGGSEIWGAPERFALGLSIGAPPDPLGPQGQNWGLPPFDPLALETQGLAAFRALVAANMRHAGAIRIDHAFQLQRLFLIPRGASATEGAYVAYPFEALLAVLRLESHRHRCLVIAEDLGTGPEGFSDAIMASGILSYRVLSFEREGDGGFKPPEVYPAEALAVITTHDLPTFRGWVRGLDVDLRQTLALFDPETAERERGARREEIRRFSEALTAQGLPAEGPDGEPTLEAAMRYLARSRSGLVGLQIEDAAGELNQPNLPGVDGVHPNWRRRLGQTLDAITAPGADLSKLAAALATEGRGARGGVLASPPPRATYRLQFHKDFTFDDAAAIVPYLARLGISHVYASPIQAARPGSTHGYDIVDHTRINPELGGEEGFERLSDALKAHGLQLLLDIVPNHMGVGGADNAWWLSVLEWGELSPHAQAFDVDWERLGAHGKLVVPFLGDRYGEALEKGDLKLVFDAGEGSFSVWHWEHRLPVCPLSYPIVLDRALAALDGDPQAAATVLSISERLRAMNEETDPERRSGFVAEAEDLKARLAAAAAASPALGEAIERAVALVNGIPGQPESVGTLHRILEAQAYRPAHWRVAASDINYRRFFDINGLAGIRVEIPEVFDATHALITRLVREGRIQGLRIDHIDGLADPEGYAGRLQQAVGPGFYVVVEKILEPGEELRPWPVAGTTGYEALNLLDGLFVDGRAKPALERVYRARTGTEARYGELLRGAKTEILEGSFASELEVLVSDLKRIADADRRTRDYTVNAMRRALAEIIARFPVYRTYLGDGEAVAEDLKLIDETVGGAKRTSQLPDRSLHDFVAACLLGSIETEGPGRPAPDLVARFRRRFQQLTGPVMAKSLEDTLFYRYVPLLALNEVGGDPGHAGTSPEAFHAANAERLRAWPHALVASATHDTKRGEDARARLHALSEMPEAYAEAIERFEALAAPHLTDGRPDANDRILLFQAILGAWPLDLLQDGADPALVGPFRERMEGFALKALREAKRHTSWIHGDEAYEAAALKLLRGLLDPHAPFLFKFRALGRRLAFLGMLNGLARTALKLTVPGVPDIYQGTETWDFSLVDPDNRRPVAYDRLARGLDEAQPCPALLARWRDGRVKQRLIADLLADRRERPALYAEGSYRAVEVRGAHAAHVVAFERRRGEDGLVVVVPRLFGGLVSGEVPPLGDKAWAGTSVALPQGRFRDLLTGAEITPAMPDTPVGELFAAFPIAVLRTLP